MKRLEELNKRLDLEMEMGCLQSHYRRARVELKKIGGKLTPEEIEEWKKIRGY